jgi:DNA repair ATPase RecN
MSEIADTVREAVETPAGSHLNNAVATMVAVTATFMALCNIKDGNVVQAMAQTQAADIDTWAYYQAKSTRQYLAEAMVDQMSLQLETTPSLSPAARALIEPRLAEYRARVKRYEAEKAEIKAKAEELQREYDRLNVRDDQFDMAEACLSLAIALSGITALTRRRWLFGVASVFAGLGLVLGLAGFLGWTLHPDALARLLT